MEKIFEQLFKLIDNSIIEKILKKVIISNDMTPEQVMFINLFIENDKKNDFLRIKYIYLSEFLINFGYFADKVEDRKIFKIIVSGSDYRVVCTNFGRLYSHFIFLFVTAQPYLSNKASAR